MFVVSATQEVFRSYEDFLSKTVLYGRPVWSCALSGKGALTYEEAVKEEAKAKAALSKVSRRAAPPGRVPLAALPSMRALAAR